LKLDVAVLRDGSLLHGDHLALHLRQLGGRLLIAADEERCRPKDDDRSRSTTPSLVRWLSCAPESVAALVDMA